MWIKHREQAAQSVASVASLCTICQAPVARRKQTALDRPAAREDPVMERRLNHSAQTSTFAETQILPFFTTIVAIFFFAFTEFL